MKATDYKLIEDYRWSEFHAAIRLWMRNGWQPLGGVAVSFNDGGSIKTYVQAMILPESHQQGGGEG